MILNRNKERLENFKNSYSPLLNSLLNIIFSQNLMKAFGLCFSLIIFISCSKNKFYEQKVFVGENVVSAQTLNLGYTTYMDYCVSCHGEKGDGQGVSSKGLYPPPRDFRKGIYKFGTVVSGEIPTDHDFANIIRKGLKGTSMLPWDISDERLNAVIQYIKTFAPQTWESKDLVVGKKVELIADPYSANKEFAISKGKEVYHITANCQSCHMGYVQKSEYQELYSKLNQSSEIPEIPEDFYKIKLQASEYNTNTIPPDFTWHSIRSAETVEELAIRIASGVNGSAMPSWKGVIEDHEIWSVAYYIKSLTEVRGNYNMRREIILKSNQ
jgi:mono/diheme cytochrome c family protein